MPKVFRLYFHADGGVGDFEKGAVLENYHKERTQEIWFKLPKPPDYPLKLPEVRKNRQAAQQNCR